MWDEGNTRRCYSLLFALFYTAIHAKENHGDSWLVLYSTLILPFECCSRHLQLRQNIHRSVLLCTPNLILLLDNPMNADILTKGMHTRNAETESSREVLYASPLNGSLRPLATNNLWSKESP